MTEEEKKKVPHYPRLNQWCKEYGRSDVPDQRGIGDFMECETTEQVKALQAELIAISEKRYDERIFDQLIGNRRKSKFGSYHEWAKMMLQWIASYRG